MLAGFVDMVGWRKTAKADVISLRAKANGCFVSVFKNEILQFIPHL